MAPSRIVPKLYWVVLLLPFFLTGCGEGNIVLDNPRGEAVTFTFDGDNAHEVSSRATKEISLDPGEHTVKMSSRNGVLADTTFEVKAGGIVHSGESYYLVWRQLFGLQDDRATLLNEDWVEFDSTRVFGDFKVYPPHVLYIERAWDLGLDEPMPESKTLTVAKDFVVESKIYRAKEFAEMYQQARKGR